VDEVVVAECGTRAPKHTEFNLAKRLQRGAEELLSRGSMSSLRKTWGAAQIVKAAKKGKEPKSAVQQNSRRRQRKPGAAPTSPPRLLRAGRRPEM
jgi:hypothetical protein